jgi:predicted permease
VVGQSTTFLTAIAIGLLLRFDGLRQDALALGLVLVLNLVAHPLLGLYAADGFGFQDPKRTVFVLEAAMPVAPWSPFLPATTLSIRGSRRSQSSRPR